MEFKDYYKTLGVPKTATEKEIKQALYSSQIDAGLVHESLDQSKPLELFTRVQPHAADRSRGLDQSQPFVLAERLRVHTQELRGHTDEQQFLFNSHMCCTLENGRV